MEDILFGYERVSTTEQSVAGQRERLLAAGVPEDRIYTDQGVSGRIASRPEWDRCINDIMMVRSAVPAEVNVVLCAVKLDRFGRSVSNLLKVLNELTERGIGIKVLDQGGGCLDTTSAMGKCFLTIMAAFAQLEADLNSERTLSGLAAAEKKGGRARALSDTQIEQARDLLAMVDERGNRKHTVTGVARDLGVSRQTLHNALAGALDARAEKERKRYDARKKKG